MTVKKRENGVYYFRFMHNNKIYYRSCKTTNKKQAEQFEAKFKLELFNKKELGHKETIRLFDCLDLQLNEIRRRGYDAGVPTHIKNIKKYFKDDPEIHKLSSADLFKFKEHLKDRGYKKNTINHHFATLRQSINRCKEMDYEVNYALSFPKTESEHKRVRTITQKQEQELLDTLNPDLKDVDSFRTTQQYYQHRENYHLVILLLDTGCRYSEVAKMSWDDVNINNRIIKVWRNKTRSQTELYMTNRVRELLITRRQTKVNNYVFPSHDKTTHRKYSTAFLMPIIKKILGDDFTVHDLRHCAASKLINNGMSIDEVCVILGHKNTNMTRLYAHLEKGDIAKKAANILDNMTGSVDFEKEQNKNIDYKQFDNSKLL